MTAGTIKHGALLRIKNGQEESGKMLGVGAGVYLAIDPFQNQARRFTGVQLGPQGSLDVGGQDTGGHALAADIGDDHTQLAVLPLDQIEIVTGNLFAADINGLHLYPGKTGNGSRQQA